MTIPEQFKRLKDYSDDEQKAILQRARELGATVYENISDSYVVFDGEIAKDPLNPQNSHRVLSPDDLFVLHRELTNEEKESLKQWQKLPLPKR